MSEKLTLKNFSTECRTVDSDKTIFISVAGIMNRIRKNFFSSSGFTRK